MKKRQIIASLAALLLSSNTCFADFLYQDGEFFINGELGADFAEKAVAIEVFAPGKDFSDITSENIMSVMPYKTQVKTDSEGKYEISFKLSEDDAVSGEYNAYIFANGVSKNEKLLFSNPKRAKAAAELMNEAFSSEAEDSVKKADIAQIIEDYSADLKIPESILREDTAENATELILAHLGNGAVDENNVCEVSTKAAGIAALNAGEEINITENADIFDLKSSEIKDFYEKNYVTSDTGADMAARLAEKDFESFEEFDEALLESFILAVVKNPDGSDNVKELLKEFASEIGIDKDGKTKQYTGVAGKDYDSFSDLKEAFEDYGKESTGGGGGSSSSKGSSSGGGKSAGVGTIVTIPETSKPVEAPTYPMTVFDDLGGFPWAEDAIVYLAERSMINGKGNQKFCPGDNITREEFVKIIVNALEVEPESLKALSFTDVDSDDWYYSFVQKAYSAGVAGGFSDTYFGAGQNITREDMATMIVRAAKASGIVFSEPEEDDRFADSDTISDYAKESVHVLKKAGIVNGVSDNNFAPKAYATRAEAAKMIYGLIRN